MKPIQVLVICPTPIDYINCQHLIEQHRYQLHCLDAPLAANGFSQDFKIDRYLDQCRRLIQEHHIDVVVATRDIPSILQAQLCQDFEHLRGPSVESTFLCANKYYTHQWVEFNASQYRVLPIPLADTISTVVDESYSLPQSLSIETGWTELLKDFKVPFPWILKPCMSACSSLIFKVNSHQEAIETADIYRRFILNNLSYLQPLLRNGLDQDKYPLQHTYSVLVEAYIDVPHKCCVDGCISQGDIVIWGISDSHYYLESPDSLADFTFPSSLPPSIQNHLRQAYRDILNRLIAYGFDNQFIDVEFFVSEEGDLTVMEVNGRMAPAAAPLYRQCLSQGDPYTALINLGLGDRVSEPTLNGQVGGTFYLSTLGQGLAEDFLDFESARQFENLEIRVKPQQAIVQNGLTSVSLATVSLVGRNYQELHSEANKIRQLVLKQPDLSPWK